MSAVQMILILLFLFFFILTRMVWVRIIKMEKLRIEIHLPLICLCLSAGDKRTPKKKEESEKLSARAYFRIITVTINRVKKAEIIIKKIVLPYSIKSFGTMTLVRPFGYQGLIYSLIAYLKTKTQKLVLEDNAIISSPDITETHYYFTVKLRLFQLFYAVVAFKRGLRKEKRARGLRYVGE